MPQSINTISPEYYRDKYENRLLKFVEKENMWKRFMLGEKMDEGRFLQTFMMYDKTCPESCSMLDYIWDKIEGKLQDKCPPKSKGFYTAIQVYKQETNEPTQEESCNIIGNCVTKTEW
jgi:hypothetical protein